jgi:type IV secretion system protein VirD4
MIRHDKEWYRYGSARFATRSDLAASGMLRPSPSATFLGFFEGRPIWGHGDGGLLMVAGARSGKLRDVLAYNLCSGICSASTLLVLDVKGEIAAISRDQTPDRKHCHYWNPLGLHGLPQDRINPAAYLQASSATLFSDMKVFVEGLIPLSGAANASYFELNARRFVEAIALTLVRINGELTLPDLYRTVSLIPAAGKPWLDFAWEMHASGIDLCRTVEAEIAAAREDSSGGFRGILGEMQKAVSCLSDPLLQDAVSPPYDFSLSQLCADQPVQFYLMAPPEMISPWSPVIKSIFTAAMIYKASAPQAPRQTWILDECAQLKGFELVEKMFSYGAGIGIRPWAIFQNVSQMDALSRNARRIIPSSAGVQSYFGLRDWDSARLVSDMLGVETLDAYDDVRQGRALRESRTLLQSVLSGGDAFKEAARLEQLIVESRHRTLLRRPLQTPDEVLNMEGDRQFIFADGLPGAIYAERAPYWTQQFMAGRYHPNPYHPPLDRVRVQGRLGPEERPVIVEHVPDVFADYPQYRSGLWSYVGG